jgi:hypothetical protein
MVFSMGEVDFLFFDLQHMQRPRMMNPQRTIPPAPIPAINKMLGGELCDSATSASANVLVAFAAAVVFVAKVVAAAEAPVSTGCSWMMVGVAVASAVVLCAIAVVFCAADVLSAADVEVAFFEVDTTAEEAEEPEDPETPP